MKKIILLFGLLCTAGVAFSQDRKDTAGGLKYERATPLSGPDTGAYDNPVYRNGIKKAEYQNRGAEDRRNPNSADPNAQPNKAVPDKRVTTPAEK